MKKLSLLVLTVLAVSCGEKKAVVTAPGTPAGIPVNPAYDPTLNGTVIPETVINEDKQVEQVPVEQVKQQRVASKGEVDVKLSSMIHKMKDEFALGFMSKDDVVKKYTEEYLKWLDERHTLHNSVPEWLWERFRESFDYAGQVIHLKKSLPIVFGAVLCDGTDRPEYIEAMSYVSAVSVEIIAAVVCYAGGTTATVASLVCAPIGYVAGAGLGEFILGPAIYDWRCK